MKQGGAEAGLTLLASGPCSWLVSPREFQLHQLGIENVQNIGPYFLSHGMVPDSDFVSKDVFLGLV